MSFHFNLSSSEEDSDDIGEEGNLVAVMEDGMTPMCKDLSVAVMSGSQQDPLTGKIVRSNVEFSESEEDDEDVEWEDASSLEESNGAGAVGGGGGSELATDTGPSSDAVKKRVLPTKDVTIDFDDRAPEDSEKKKRRRKYRVNKLQNLSPEVAALVLDLHRSHMLTLASRAMLISRCCSDDELLHSAYSLLPVNSLERFCCDIQKQGKPQTYQTPQMPSSEIHTRRSKRAGGRRGAKMAHNVDGEGHDDIPTACGYSVVPAPNETDVKRLCNWFFDMVNRTEERRTRTREANVAAGAPRRGDGTGRRRSSQRRGMETRLRSGNGAVEQVSKSSPFFARTTKSGRALNEGDGVTSPRRLLDLCHYLSPTHDEDPHFLENDNAKTITPHEKTQLLVAFARSVGWRARYVSSLDPMGRDLTVNHPLLTSGIKDVFRFVHMRNGGPRSGPGISDLRTVKSKKRKSSHDNSSKCKRRAHDEANGRSKVDAIDLVDDDVAVGLDSMASPRTRPNGGHKVTRAELGSGGNTLAWVEIFCYRDGNPLGDQTRTDASCSSTCVGRASPSFWMHIDPAREIVHKPQEMESLLTDIRKGAVRRGEKRKRQANTPFSYVLAVEWTTDHGESDTPRDEARGLSCAAPVPVSPPMVRLTDVTPRYANTWSKTLRLRGATGSQIVAGGGKCVDVWWAETIRRTNRLFRRQARPKGRVVSNEDRSTSATTQKAGSSETSKVVGTGDTNGEGNLTRGERKATADVVVVDDTSEEENQVEKERPSSGDESDDLEEQTVREEQDELLASTAKEAIPTSKDAFKKHPLYAIPSVLNSSQVLAPDARKRICGVFKGELVYKRSDVSTAMVAKRWLYNGRKVREEQLGKPVKKVKARKRSTPKGFKALRTYGVGETNDGSEEANKRDIEASSKSEEYDGMDHLYGKWQTEEWSPPAVAPNEDIPVNEFNNIELELLNPGLVHLEETGMSVVAKKLGIPYAPCLVGFEGHGGNRTPSIRGIAVHAHNADLLREAQTEWQSRAIEQENEARQKEIYRRWKRLVVGIMTKDRLDREYG